MPSEPVTLTLPVDGYEGVGAARQRRACLAARLRLRDRRRPAARDRARASLAPGRGGGRPSRSRCRRARIAHDRDRPRREPVARPALRPLDGAGRRARRSLARLVDSVEIASGAGWSDRRARQVAAGARRDDQEPAWRPRPTGARCCAPTARTATSRRATGSSRTSCRSSRSLARRYAGRGEQLDDLEQVASLGLIKAIDRFDLDREVDLVTYIFPTVVGELKRHFRDRVWAVTVPRRLKELYQLLSQAARGADRAQRPLADDRGARRGGGRDRGRGRRGARGGPRLHGALADRPCTTRQDGEVEPIDLLEDEERGYEAAENRRAPRRRASTSLDERERRILQLRFVDGLTQSQIAAEIGVSQMHVSRLLRRALEKLEREIEEP